MVHMLKSNRTNLIVYKLHNSEILDQCRGQDSHFNMLPLMCGGPTKYVDHNRERGLAQHLRDGSDTMLKSNRPNSISKDALRDEGYP